MSETKYTFCRICESACGLQAEIQDGKVVSMAPNKAHIGTDGFACMKGLLQHKMYDSPDRLQYPLKRVGEQWQRISWEQALGEIGAKVKQLRGLSPDAIAMYVGTAAGFSILHPIFAQGFMQGLGSRNIFSSATQDCANRFACSSEMHGFPLVQPFPDLDNLNCLIVAGTNPVVSKWTFLQVAHPVKRLKGLAARGAKLFFVDPRYTESAKVAGEHVFIRPGTDLYFFLSFLHEVFVQDGVKTALVDAHMTGLEQIRDLVEPWTAERSEALTSIKAAQLRAMVSAYLQADGAAIMTGTGIGMGRNGTLTQWLVEVINAVTGNLDRKGGMLVGRGIFDFPKFGAEKGLLVGDQRSRVGNFRSVNDCVPGAILADEILTPGKDQIKALFVTGGNPLLTMANSERLRSAFKELELLVVTDIYLTETAVDAHYVLPATSPLERPDLPFIFPLVLGMQSVPYMAATDALVKPNAEQRDEATIYLDLARAAGINLFASGLTQKLFELMRLLRSTVYRKEQPSLPLRLILSLMLRASGHGSFKKMLKFPAGKARQGAQANDYLGKRVVTDDAKVHLAPARFMEKAQDLEKDFNHELAGAKGLRLITKRSHATHNSWTQNIEELTKGEAAQSNYLYVHPQDARMLGIENGSLVDVTSATATVRVPAKILADLMPGVVALPHGWGHQHAKGLSVASALSGVNVNLLAADGPDNVEELSGMANLTAIPVEVKLAAGPLDRGSWSGIAAGGRNENAARTSVQENRVAEELLTIS